MPITSSTIPIAGLNVHLFQDDRLSQDATLPIAAVFLLHGRMGHSKSANMNGIITKIFEYLGEKLEAGKTPPVNLLLVAFDHRNHGSRLVHKLSNKAWEQDDNNFNEKHALDMYATQTGTARDVSFIIDFLPAYLYPRGERQISSWGVIGVSLGGHSTWIVLKDEPRVSLGVPIIGCPDYLPLMENRAQQRSLSANAPYFPETLREFITKHDPASAPHTGISDGNPFLGKHVLVLSGAADPLVPWIYSQKFVDELEVGETGSKRVFVQEGARHEVTPEMRAEAASFVWQWIIGSLDGQSSAPRVTAAS